MEKVEEKPIDIKEEKTERSSSPRVRRVGYKIDETCWRVIKNVYLFIKSQNQYKNEGELDIKKLVAEATGISLACIYKLKLEQQDPPPKGELKKRKKTITGVSDEVKTEICKLIMEENINIKKLQERLKEADLYSGSVSSLGTIVQKCGFQYIKSTHTWISLNGKKEKKGSAKDKGKEKKTPPKDI